MLFQLSCQVLQQSQRFLELEGQVSYNEELAVRCIFSDRELTYNLSIGFHLQGWPATRCTEGPRV